MIARRNFDSLYVEGELRKLSAKPAGKTVVYVAGGAAMALASLKEATKDIDVIVEAPHGLKTLVSGLRAIGYADPRLALAINYRRMYAREILENLDGFRWDIFEKLVADKLHLSSGMIERSRTQCIEWQSPCQAPIQ